MLRQLVFAALACAALPTMAAPCAGFADIDDSSEFCASVEWMRNRGITLGLTPTTYDPHSPVTRLQMAAFMYRLGFQNAFLHGGNAFDATAVLGTTDNWRLEFVVNGSRVVRYEPRPFSPNIVGGSSANFVLPGVQGATIAGGGYPVDDTAFLEANTVTDSFGTVGGGFGNRAGDFNSNTLDGAFASVLGGQTNAASGKYSSVGGGLLNTAFGYASTVPGGELNTAAREHSFAAGVEALANGARCAVFSLWSGSPGMSCFGIDGIFLVGAPNGMSFDFGNKRQDGGGTKYVALGRVAGQTIATWTGAFLSDGGAWTNASDAALKESFEDVQGDRILESLLELPVRSWRYKSDPQGVRRIGPTAQDFRTAFGLGADDRTIATVDADGVALAAIQGLNAKLEARLAERDAEIAELRRAVEVLTVEVRDVRRKSGRGSDNDVLSQ